mmetsp:Transcript_20168/g.51377  ORF Transcript_20168/g.51377 Transcript_20168/m.51377 type:complete len:305 (-) Transcript_20168:521-1435(-)
MGGDLFIMAGLEGSGHHFFDKVGQTLDRLGRHPPHAKQLMLCAERSLGYASYPEVRPLPSDTGCRTDRCRVHELTRPVLRYQGPPSCPPPNQAWAGTRHLPFCSYPCGSLHGSGYMELVSPDLSLLEEDLAAVHSLRVVISLRHPLDGLLSAYSRRHRDEMSVGALAYQHFLSATYLDSQLGRLPSAVAWKVFYYEDVVSTNRSLPDLSAFLAMPLQALTDAITPQQPQGRRVRMTVPGGKILPSVRPSRASPNLRAYVGYLFSHTRFRPVLPRLHAPFQRYAHPARRDPGGYSHLATEQAEGS